MIMPMVPFVDIGYRAIVRYELYLDYIESWVGCHCRQVDRRHAEKFIAGIESKKDC